MYALSGFPVRKTQCPSSVTPYFLPTSIMSIILSLLLTTPAESPGCSRCEGECLSCPEWRTFLCNHGLKSPEAPPLLCTRLFPRRPPHSCFPLSPPCARLEASHSSGGGCTGAPLVPPSLAL